MLAIFATIVVAVAGIRIDVGSDSLTVRSSHPNATDHRQWKKIRELGSGADATVFLCEDDSGRQVAVKEVEEWGPRDEAMLPPAEEAAVMRILSASPNNLKCLDYFVDTNDDQEPVHKLVLELARGGTILNFWRLATRHDGNMRWGTRQLGVPRWASKQWTKMFPSSSLHVIKESLILMMTVDATCGLKGMHEKLHAHCDLKADNILAMSGDPECVQRYDCIFAISDYGRSRSKDDIIKDGYTWEAYERRDVEQLGWALFHAFVGQKAKIAGLPIPERKPAMTDVLKSYKYIMPVFKELLFDMVGLGNGVPTSSEASERAVDLFGMRYARAKYCGQRSQSEG